MSAVQHQDGGREQEHAPCGKNAEAGVAGTALMRLVDGDEVADDAASEKVARFVGRGERRWGGENSENERSVERERASERASRVLYY